MPKQQKSKHHPTKELNDDDGSHTTTTRSRSPAGYLFRRFGTGSSGKSGDQSSNRPRSSSPGMFRGRYLGLSPSAKKELQCKGVDDHHDDGDHHNPAKDGGRRSSHRTNNGSRHRVHHHHEGHHPKNHHQQQNHQLMKTLNEMQKETDRVQQKRQTLLLERQALDKNCNHTSDTAARRAPLPLPPPSPSPPSKPSPAHQRPLLQEYFQKRRSLRNLFSPTSHHHQQQEQQRQQIHGHGGNSNSNNNDKKMKPPLITLSPTVSTPPSLNHGKKKLLVGNLSSPGKVQRMAELFSRRPL